MKRKAFSTVQPLKWWASNNLVNRLKSVGDKPALVHPPHRPRRSVSRRTLRYTRGPPVPGTAGECHLWSTGTVVVLCSCAIRKFPLLTGSIWTQYHLAHRTLPAKQNSVCQIYHTMWHVYLKCTSIHFLLKRFAMKTKL